MISYLPEIEPAREKVHSLISILEEFYSFCRDRVEEVARAQDPKIKVNRVLDTRIHEKPLSITKGKFFDSPGCFVIRHSMDLPQPWFITRFGHIRVPLRKNLGVMVSPKRIYLFYFGGGYRFPRKGWTAYYPNHMDIIPVSHPQDLQILGLPVPSPEESKICPVDPIELARFLPGPLKELESLIRKLSGSEWGRFDEYEVTLHETLLEIPEAELDQDYKSTITLFSVIPGAFHPGGFGLGIKETRDRVSHLFNLKGIIVGRDSTYLKICKEYEPNECLWIDLVPTEKIGPKLRSILYIGYMGKNLLLPLSKEALRIAIRYPYGEMRKIWKESRHIRRLSLIHI